MSKQISSIDWLIEKYTIVLGLGSKELMKEHIERAKAMHKAETMQTYSDGLGNGMHFERGDGNGKDLDEEQYYKDNFA